jgi:DNA-binding CsgD family transcriptional regulator
MARIVVATSSTLMAQGLVGALEGGGWTVVLGSTSDEADAWVIPGDDELVVRGTQGAIAQLAAGTTPQRLRAAVGAVLAGLSVRDTPWSAGPAEHEPLTRRELEVFELLAKGLSNREIGEVLGITSHTAKYHVAQILAKTGASTRAEAVHEGIRLGLIGL